MPHPPGTLKPRFALRALTEPGPAQSFLIFRHEGTTKKRLTRLGHALLSLPDATQRVRTKACNILEDSELGGDLALSRAAASSPARSMLPE